MLRVQPGDGKGLRRTEHGLQEPGNDRRIRRTEVGFQQTQNARECGNICAHTIMFGAPSAAIWDMQATIARAAYTVMRVWLASEGAEDGELPPLVPGGGAAMIAMCAVLDQRLHSGAAGDEQLLIQVRNV